MAERREASSGLTVMDAEEERAATCNDAVGITGLNALADASRSDTMARIGDISREERLYRTDWEIVREVLFFSALRKSYHENLQGTLLGHTHTTQGTHTPRPASPSTGIRHL